MGCQFSRLPQAQLAHHIAGLVPVAGLEPARLLKAPGF